MPVASRVIAVARCHVRGLGSGKLPAVSQSCAWLALYRTVPSDQVSYGSPWQSFIHTRSRVVGLKATTPSTLPIW